MIVAYVHVQQNPPGRLHLAQIAMESSIRGLGLEPFRYPGSRKLDYFKDVLAAARCASDGDAFVWCNSDLVLTENPYNVPDKRKVYGFHRREIPSHDYNSGVDMYYIPVKWWDDYLSKDIPKLFLGASYVDWWISRAMQKAGAYENLLGYIDHVTHPQSEAAGSDANPYYQANFRSYNAWAKRNGLQSIPAPPYLIPRLGHVWGIRDAIHKLFQVLR